MRTKGHLLSVGWAALLIALFLPPAHAWEFQLKGTFNWTHESHENPRRFVIDPGFYDASILRKAGRFKKFRMRGLHGSLQFVVPAGDWSCWYSSS